LLRIILISFFFSSTILAQTPLEKAAETNQISMMVTLVEKGADVNGTDPDSIWERTPLIAAARRGANAAAAWLLDHDANPNVYDAAGSTALIEAVQGNHVEMVALLIRKGAETELPTQDGSNRTPLIWAILEQNPQTVELLLRAGTKTGVIFKAQFGKTSQATSALQLAQKLGNKKILNLLQPAPTP